MKCRIKTFVACRRFGQRGLRGAGCGCFSRQRSPDSGGPIQDADQLGSMWEGGPALGIYGKEISLTTL